MGSKSTKMETKIWGKSKVGEKEVSLAQHINDVLEVFQHLKKHVTPELKELIKIALSIPALHVFSNAERPPKHR